MHKRKVKVGDLVTITGFSSDSLWGEDTYLIDVVYELLEIETFETGSYYVVKALSPSYSNVCIDGKWYPATVGFLGTVAKL